MARPATKKKAGTKRAGKAKNTVILGKAERMLETLNVDVKQQERKLREARDSLRVKRAEAARKGTKAAAAMVDKAHAAVAKNVVALEVLNRKLRGLKTELKVEKIRSRVETAEKRAIAKITTLEAKLAAEAERELKDALAKFQVRWTKKRDAANAKKLKAAERKSKSRLIIVEKSAQAEVKAVERKAAKVLAAPIAAPSRPGRPKKAIVETAASAPKKRGRPAKAASAAKKPAVKKAASKQKAAPKKAGRPAKKTAPLAVASKAAGKRRGRPPKAVAAAASSAPKKRGRPAGVKKAAAPAKRRGRPPKAGKK